MLVRHRQDRLPNVRKDGQRGGRMSKGFDLLSDKQREAAEIIVDNAIEQRQGGKKLSQAAIGEMVGVTDRTIRNWQNDETFLGYLRELSVKRLQAAMPDFVGVLISNLSKGQNVSTKQLDLIAKVANWMPEPKSSAATTVNVQVGTTDIHDRIKALEDRKMANVVPNVKPEHRIGEFSEAVYVDGD